MANFACRRRFRTSRPRLNVAPGLSVGRHVFELVVEDECGNRSQPVRVGVEILPAPDQAAGGKPARRACRRFCR